MHKDLITIATIRTQLAVAEAEMVLVKVKLAVEHKARIRAICLIDRLISEYAMPDDPSVVDLGYCFEACEVCEWPKCWFCGVQYMESEGISMLVATAESIKGDKPGNILKFVCHVCADPKQEQPIHV